MPSLEPLSCLRRGPRAASPGPAPGVGGLRATGPACADAETRAGEARLARNRQKTPAAPPNPSCAKTRARVGLGLLAEVLSPRGPRLERERRATRESEVCDTWHHRFDLETCRVIAAGIRSGDRQRLSVAFRIGRDGVEVSGDMPGAGT